MKNAMIFVAGVAVGTGIAMLLLHKQIKKELDSIRIEGNLGEMPFTVGSEEGQKVSESTNEAKNEEKKPVVTATKGFAKAVQGPHTAYETMYSAENDDDDDEIIEPEPVGISESDGGIHEIDADEFMHNSEYVNSGLYYFPEQEIVATDSGTILKAYDVLIGENWKNSIGKYAPKTAFVRNEKLSNDYEITVMECLYEDEFPDGDD